MIFSGGRIRFLVGWVFSAFIILAIARSQPVEKMDVPTAPLPVWVEPLAWQPPTQKTPPGTPAEVIISDGQSRLTTEAGEYYSHLVVKLHTSDGLRDNAEISLEYSPEYQAIVWHKLNLIRGSEVIDLLKTTTFSRLRRELGFEAKIYDGQYTLAAVIEDIRVGDIIEKAFTLTDTNPLMRGHLSSRYALGSYYPIGRQRVIVRVPAAIEKPASYFWVPRGTSDLPAEIFRVARLRLALQEQVVGDERVYRWDFENIPAVAFDGAISAQASPYYPTIRCSTYSSWSAVANWAHPLFARTGPFPTELASLVEGWKRDLSTPEERLRAAVNWAQDGVRYFAMAMGPHNLQPRSLAEICSSRFGDCKDKTVLLVALLRELGFEAWPALVNAHAPQRVLDGGPDQYAFNHAIVAYMYQGSVHWVDPTFKQPAGAAGAWQIPPYRWGLILRPDEPGLSAIPPPPLLVPDTTLTDRMVIDEATGDAVLHSQTILRGIQADYYRQYFESTAPREVAKYWFNNIGRFYRRVQELEAPVVTDNRNDNVLTITARYQLPALLKKEGGRNTLAVYAYGIRGLLEQPETRRRSWPYGLPTDRFIRHRIEVELPFSVPLEQRPQVISSHGVEYRGEKSLAGRQFRASHDLLVTGVEVAAADMPVFCDTVEEILMDLSTPVLQPAPAPAAAASIP